MSSASLWLGRLFGLKRKAQSADDAFSQKGRPNRQDWVVVMRTFDVIEARFAESRLLDQEIPCRLRQEAASSALPVQNGILGRIDILVPEPFLEEAVQVLEDTLSSEENDEPV